MEEEKKSFFTKGFIHILSSLTDGREHFVSQKEPWTPFLFFSPSMLITYDDVVKISDFGTSKELSDKSTKMSFAGTVAWMAPEVIRNEPVSEKVDIWWGELTQKRGSGESGEGLSGWPKYRTTQCPPQMCWALASVIHTTHTQTKMCWTTTHTKSSNRCLFMHRFTLCPLDVFVYYS